MDKKTNRCAHMFSQKPLFRNIFIGVVVLGLGNIVCAALLPNLSKKFFNTHDSFHTKKQDPLALEKVVFAEVAADTRDPKAVEPLFQYLDDSNPVIRWKAYVALGKIGNSQAIAILEQRLPQEDGGFWKFLTDSIEETSSEGFVDIKGHILAIGPPIIPYIKKMISTSRSFRARKMMREALEELGTMQR